MKTITLLAILLLLSTCALNAQQTRTSPTLKSEIKPRTAPPPPPPKPPPHSDTNKLIVTIWPSPATDVFNLLVKTPSAEKIKVQVYDLSGRSMLRFEAENEKSISFGASLESSLYIVHVSQEAFDETVKIVKTD